MTGQLLTADQVAELLQVDVTQVRKLRRLGLIVGVNVNTNVSARGAKWRYEPAAVDRFIRDRRQTTPNSPRGTR